MIKKDMDNIEALNSDEISNLLVEKDKNIISQMDLLETIQKEKHNVEVKLMEITEAVRMGKKLISRMRVEREILERIYWKARNK